jgi:5-methylthioadenosine/S-adenosylhomocysteine deaminase
LSSSEADVVIKADIVVTMKSPEEVHSPGFVAIKDDRIVEVGSTGRLHIRAKETMNLRGHVLMPGLVNTHTHSPMTLMRGVIEDVPLDRWLNEICWPLERHLTAEHVYDGSLLAQVEMLKNGVTTFNDHYFHMDEVVRALSSSGCRAALCHAIIEAGDTRRGRRELAESVRFARRYSHHPSGRIKTFLGPHAEYSCSEELLRAAGNEAKAHGLAVHMHFAEDRDRYEQIKKRKGMEPALMLDRMGLLAKGSVFAHGVHMSEREARLLAKRGVSLSHNPVSNMKVVAGLAPISRFKRAGLVVGLGTDGPASNNTLDLLRDLRVAAILRKAVDGDAFAGRAFDVLKEATADGAKAIGWGPLLGTLEAGKKADVVAIDTGAPHFRPLVDVYASLVYSATGADVSHVFVDGRLVVNKRRLTTLNETEVMTKAERSAKKLLKLAGF